MALSWWCLAVPVTVPYPHVEASALQRSLHETIRDLLAHATSEISAQAYVPKLIAPYEGSSPWLWRSIQALERGRARPRALGEIPPSLDNGATNLAGVCASFHRQDDR